MQSLQSTSRYTDSIFYCPPTPSILCNPPNDLNHDTATICKVKTVHIVLQDVDAENILYLNGVYTVFADQKMLGHFTNMNVAKYALHIYNQNKTLTQETIYEKIQTLYLNSLNEECVE